MLTAVKVDDTIKVVDEHGNQRMLFYTTTANRIMYRYGKSKIMHWSKNCATPNAGTEPTIITMQEGALAGLKPCKNCWGRTQHVDLPTGS